MEMEIGATNKKRHWYVVHSSGVIFAFTKPSMRRAYLENTPALDNRVVSSSSFDYGSRVAAFEVDSSEELAEVIRDVTPWYM